MYSVLVFGVMLLLHACIMHEEKATKWDCNKIILGWNGEKEAAFLVFIAVITFLSSRELFRNSRKVSKIIITLNPKVFVTGQITHSRLSAGR